MEEKQVKKYPREVLCFKHIPGMRLCEFLVRIRDTELSFFKNF
ncbi:MAG: hypothetical protein ACUVQ0_01430 [Thermoproteota archaeon]